ncbi:MAG: hypothetical protein J6Z11_17040, partial [Candidatus Riflebacteria bacterium]|nr:hypothetical protein [Candidatus Riflebacteria bacterium]
EISQINKKQAYQVQQQQIINTKLISMGYSANQILAKDELAEKLKVIKAEYATRIKEAKGAQKKILKDEMDAAVKAAKSKVDTLINEILEKSEELDKKQKKKQSQQLLGGAQGNLSQTLSTSPFNIQELKQALEDLSDDLRETLGEEAGLGKGDKAKLMLASAATALANYTKQLASQIKEIAYAQSEIDTRLQGSNLNKTYFGSYWKQMNQDIIRYVGMSPLIKQADVVNSLKTLVGKGIAFNVEQRAFLDTVSEKIANTFEATDATLLKLVRIQQADTTAARLGMESALTAFLNNMYETTEYMTEAAASIRSSLYEASALMGAAEATAFEYQVQKWMGSLYSVGFSNTEGLAGALGKLAAGDISAINNGGYGNLLIMAANRAGISIADILAEGLDDSDTNKLLQAVVEYLGDIYAETRNSKVVAQQFANIYGLTASDLKAAANLFGSTDTIGKNTMGYTGMIKQLQRMAGSMYSRMGTGEMLENLFDNFKNSIATSMGNNPVLYTIFTLGNMLKDTTGGIDIPLPLYMGTCLNAKLNVADLMLATSLA